jgi:cytochrome c556
VKIQKPILRSCLAAAVLLGGVSSALRAADPVAERHDLMEAVDDAQHELSAIAKKQAPFDAAVVAKNAGLIADKLKAAEALFPPGSEGGRAKPAIWTAREAFDKGLKDSQAAAVALQSIKDEAAYGPAFQVLSASCRSCHTTYRAPRR